jgi:hypothetical protein
VKIGMIVAGALVLLAVAACDTGGLESAPPGAAIMCDAVDSTGAAWSELGSNREEASAAAMEDCRERSPDPLTCVVSMCGFLEE